MIAPHAEETRATAEIVTESAQVRAQLRLREMILAGELPGGTRIAELSIVEKLGVSRTPIRAALMRLEQEGLIESLPNGSYAVRTLPSAMCPRRSSCAAPSKVKARLAAERGVAPVVMGEARECLQRIDQVLPAYAERRGFLCLP